MLIAASMRCCGVYDGSKPNEISVQSKTCLRSSSGTPTRSAITCSGSQSARSSTRSQPARPARSSMRRCTRASTRSVRSATRLGVKPRLTSLRSWVWRGASRLISSSLVPPSFSPSAKLPSSRNGLGLFLKFVSREVRWTSAWRVMFQYPSSQCGCSRCATGSASRSSRKASYGKPRSYVRGSCRTGVSGRMRRPFGIPSAGEADRERLEGVVEVRAHAAPARRSARSCGNVASSSSKNTRPSSRARWTPRQKCSAMPNDRCGFGSRRMSKRCGSANTSSSRLADV